MRIQKVSSVYGGYSALLLSQLMHVIATVNEYRSESRFDRFPYAYTTIFLRFE